MIASSPATAAASDFEFEALQHANNYRDALCAEFGPFLTGDVLEVGAGIGQFTECLRQIPTVRHLVSVEPDSGYCARHREKFKHHQLIEGTVADVPSDSDWDSILSVNVLEHIGDDEDELKRYGALLRKNRGALCLFVPARPEIYAPIDHDFGHFRRYTRPELKRKLVAAGFEILKLNYYNCVGYAAWWLNFCVLKKRCFSPGNVLFFDRVIFPMVHAIESKLIRPPIGQSLITVARQRGAS
jgi:SAM-dependent methyltransferase